MAGYFQGEREYPAPPSLEGQGKEPVEIIAEFRAQNPGKRVFVHCKGGIARASTMTLAHAILNRGEDPHVAIKEMQRNRHVLWASEGGSPDLGKRTSKEANKDEHVP
jgi:protein-tyrosine phosphatase